MGVKLTIYYTSDTHGYLYPTNFADTKPRAMGLLGMNFPKDGNTLVIDGGDTLQGSPLAYYCHRKGLPMPMAAVMNDLGYDYITLGNHDFNYGYDTIRESLAELNARCLCANVRDRRGKLPICDYTVHTLENGLRVGLVGIVTDWVNLWEKPENLTDLVIGDPFTAAKEAASALRGQCDVLVGIYHGGLEKDTETGETLSTTTENIACRLCEAIPFDLLLTGHQHIAMVNRVWHGTHVVQTPCNATKYVRVTMDQNGVFASTLLTPHKEVSLKPWETKLFADLTAWLDKPIGRLSRAVWPENKLSMALHGTAIADFINQVQLDASGAQLSCTALGNELRGFDSSVTVRDVVASYVYSNTLVVLEVTGAQLRAALEQCATYFSVDENGAVSIGEKFVRPKQAHYNYDYYAGIEYRFDLREPIGRRVTALAVQGRPVADDERFSLVMNNYRATGAGDFDYFAKCKRLREMQTEVSELILNYLSERSMVMIPDERPYTVILPDGCPA
ncbi:MAG: bifunctional UDP-sugar hydrolase/5'-nucleotidase [Eubacteriales bacterium]|nr:bifunctional UDP-sugar hydrolase/5'-nucleotidase [Eubacteriales bacterium]